MAVTITKPTIGGSEDSWGLILNNTLDNIGDGFNGATAIEPNLTAGSWKIGGVAVTASAADLNGLNGLTASAAELNVLDGDTSASTVTVAGADKMILNDAGVMKQITIDALNSYVQGQAGSANNAPVTLSAGSGIGGGGSFTTDQASASTISFNVDAGNGLSQTANGLAMSGSFSGSFTASGDITAFSDAALKSDIQTITDALNRVTQMRGVFFDKDGRRGTGVVAQEVQNAIPEAVHDSGEYLSVAYGNLVGVLIEAVKELATEVKALKNGVTK